MNPPSIKTLSELRKSGYQSTPLKEELRRNLVAKLRSKEPLFEGIIGYEESVIPQVVNAILSKHHFILLGLRGQAKTRILRQLVNFLDEYIPVIKGSVLNEDPLKPVTKYGREKAAAEGDHLEIEWLHRSERYNEKLATPDVTMADLIGDVDPVKAVTKKLSFSDEEIIHFGIIPRTNRGIFAINELPDLQPRIQVGLFNILEESDLQIRGFPIRFPIDILLVFSANPEDYTNRGNIVTPLKDRIDSQIITHYPRSLEQSMAITEQEAWLRREGEVAVVIPGFFKELVEQITIEARRNRDYVDQKSGVSVRMTISSMENLVSNVERRALLTGESKAYPRVSDLLFVTPAMTGKMELVYEGEQEGPVKVARAVIGLAIRSLFTKYCPPLEKKGGRKDEAIPAKSPYDKIVRHFEEGGEVRIESQSGFDAYWKSLDAVPGLREFAEKHFPAEGEGREQLAFKMEFVLEGLHFNSRLSKSIEGEVTHYGDMIASMMGQKS